MNISLDVNSIYRFITNPPLPFGLKITEQGYVVAPDNEEWKSKNSRMLQVSSKDSPYVSLPYPFVRGKFQIERIAKEYKAGVVLETAIESFYQSQEWIQRIYPEIKKAYSAQFLPIPPRGGYIMDLQERAPLMAIQAFDDGITINTGTEGGKLRLLRDKEGFAIEMGALEKVANQILSLGLGEKNKYYPINLTLSVH